MTAASHTEDRTASRRLTDPIAQLEPRLPKIAALLEEAEDDVLAFYALPSEHWPKLRSTNPQERFNREIGRRTDIVGIFPDDPSVIRLVSMLAIEANDEWFVGRSYISKQSMATLYDRRSDGSLSLTRKKRSPSSPQREHPRLPDEMSHLVSHRVPGLDSDRQRGEHGGRRAVVPEAPSYARLVYRPASSRKCGVIAAGQRAWTAGERRASS